MSDYIVQGENLTAIANKIREKTGEEGALEFPNEFVSAIDDMVVPSGNQDIDTTNEYNVEEKATARISATEREKIISENIKKDVTILGVTGSYEGSGGISGGYNVTFIVNNEQYTFVSVPQGGSINEPLAPTVSGQFFKGWTINGTSKVTFPYTPVADTVMSAMLEENVIIGFTGLTREDGVLTLTDDIANVGSYTVESDGNYSVVSNPLDNYFPFSELTEITDTEGNVFVKFPLMYMKWIIDTETGLVDGVKFSNHKVDEDFFISDAYLDPLDTAYGTYVDYFAIGKYEGSVNTDILYSKTNENLISGTAATLRTYSRQSRSNRYGILDAQIITIYNLLCCLYYRTSNIQKVCLGITNNTQMLSTGNTDGVVGKNGWNNANQAIKLLGIENPFGNAYKYIDGITVDGNTGTNQYNYYVKRCFGDGNGLYTTFKQPQKGFINGFKCDYTNYHLKSVLLPYSSGGTDETYCGDKNDRTINALTLTPISGGKYDSGTKAGLFYFDTDTLTSASYYTRLCYKGNNET